MKLEISSFRSWRLSRSIGLILMGLIMGGSIVRSEQNSAVGHWLTVLPEFPGAEKTSMPDPGAFEMLPRSPSLRTASAEYIVPVNTSQSEKWYQNEFSRIHWNSSGLGTSYSNGVAIQSEEEFATPSHPLITIQLSFKALSENKTLVHVLVTDLEIPRSAATLLSTEFNRAKVTIYSTSDNNKQILRSFIANNSSVVHDWISVFNSLPIAPKSGATTCAQTALSAKILFSAIGTSNQSQVTLNPGCGIADLNRSIILLDIKGKFWQSVDGYS